MATPSRILVIGASGFVGSSLVPLLRSAFPTAAIVPAGGARAPADGGATSAPRVSLLEPASLEPLFANPPDVVVHLAARSSVAESAHAAHDTMQVNLQGTLHLAEAVRRFAPGAAVVFASTGEVYGATFLQGPAREADPLQPRNPYARSKVACEYALRDALGDRHPVIMLRLFNHTGPGQDERFVTAAFAAQIARAERGLGPTEIAVGDLTAERDLLDVRDVLDAYCAVIADAAGAAPSVETYNVSSGAPTAIQTILDVLLSEARVEVTVKVHASRLRPSDIPRAVGDSSAFRARFGWSPRFSVADTCRTVLAYWRDRVEAAR